MGWVGGRAGSYLAVCGTDWDADVGSQHHCECRGQFNSESTVEGGGKRRGGEGKRRGRGGGGGLGAGAGAEVEGGGSKETSFIVLSWKCC